MMDVRQLLLCDQATFLLVCHVLLLTEQSCVLVAAAGNLFLAANSDPGKGEGHGHTPIVSSGRICIPKHRESHVCSTVIVSAGCPQLHSVCLSSGQSEYKHYCTTHSHECITLCV